MKDNPRTIRAVIVEDQLSSYQNLLTKLSRSCPIVEVVSHCDSVPSAVQAIHQIEPQLVFLDVELGAMTGFDVLERLRHVNFEVIFVTGYDQYAIQALRSNALDYLMKPLDEALLINAVDKARQRIEQQRQTGGAGDNRIAAPVQGGFRFIRIAEITDVQAEDNMANIFRYDRKPQLVCRTLKYLTEKLEGYQFFRIHRTHTVNRDYIVEFNREDGGYVIVKRKEENAKKNHLVRLPIARDRRVKFEAWLFGES